MIVTHVLPGFPLSLTLSLLHSEVSLNRNYFFEPENTFTLKLPSQLSCLLLMFGASLQASSLGLYLVGSILVYFCNLNLHVAGISSSCCGADRDT